MEIMTYQSYFDNFIKEKSYEIGVKQNKIDPSILCYESWETKFTENVYQNEKIYKNLTNLDQNGER